MTGCRNFKYYREIFESAGSPHFQKFLRATGF